MGRALNVITKPATTPKPDRLTSGPDTGKGVGLAEDLQVPVKAGGGDGEELVSVAVEIPGQRAAVVQAERDAVVLAPDTAVPGRLARAEMRSSRCL